jgi:hypothetical protein
VQTIDTTTAPTLREEAVWLLMNFPMQSHTVSNHGPYWVKFRGDNVQLYGRNHRVLRLSEI